MILFALLHLLPQPARVETLPCGSHAFELRSIAANFDPGAREELDERWGALGLGRLQVVFAGKPSIASTLDPALAPQAYRLTVRDGLARIESSDADGAFYAAMTLAQLPQRAGSGWTLPCVRIEDRPALRWRVLSDDVSRGPLPTMRYFKERIRTIAAFKMNGYSPYMEHVFIAPTDPLPAPLDGITPAQLRELAAYAGRFHVTLIPQQQTFAHMHGTLRLEKYASAAEFPHGFLMAPNVALSQEYLSRVIGAELSAVGRVPFFHIGSDETATLGLGTTAAYVAKRGLAQTFADHVRAMNELIAPSGARIMLWDDSIEKDAAIEPLLPKNAVIVNWHYGADTSFQPYIEKIARGGFEQMVAPGAGNWNQIFPVLSVAIPNEQRFVNQGKAAKVLGMFETVWHDDGETLYETTWFPVIYAAAAAWQQGDADPNQVAADFPATFFGSDDLEYSHDVAELGVEADRLNATRYDGTDPLFWADAFDAGAGARMSSVDLAAVRTSAESVQRHLYFANPPLHANAAFAMFLSARRYDALARKFQIGAEVRAMYADAQSHLDDTTGSTLRDLFWCRYWMWELRDSFEDLAPLYARAWRYESREGHLASNLEAYHLAAQRAITRADAFYRATYDDFVPKKTLPPLESVIGP